MTGLPSSRNPGPSGKVRRRPRRSSSVTVSRSRSTATISPHQSVVTSSTTSPLSAEISTARPRLGARQSVLRTSEPYRSKDMGPNARSAPGRPGGGTPHRRGVVGRTIAIYRRTRRRRPLHERGRAMGHRSWDQPWSGGGERRGGWSGGPPPWVQGLIALAQSGSAPPFASKGPKVRRGDVRAAILDVLAVRPMNGYQIIQEIADRTGGTWKPSPGSVYP